MNANRLQWQRNGGSPLVVAAPLVVGFWAIATAVPGLSTSRMLDLPLGDPLADDAGLYLVVPRAMALTGITDPRLIVWFLALVAFGVALVVTWRHGPIVTLLLVFSAPWAISAGAAYWVPAWAIWTGLLSRPSGAGIVGIIATVFRSSAGIPVVANAIIRRPRLGFVLVPALVAATVLLSGHVLWHSIYIGLGWLANPYGISYHDEAGIAAVARLAPGVAYASADYEAVLRAEVLRIATADPGFVAANVIAKLAAAVALASPWILFVPLALWRLPGQRLALGIPLLLSLLPLVAVVPVAEYGTGWVAACVLVTGLGLETLRERGLLADGAGIEPARVSPTPT